ncbi:MAG: hypothetical protein OHK0045_00700 [Raineya sp.]
MGVWKKIAKHKRMVMYVRASNLKPTRATAMINKNAFISYNAKKFIYFPVSIYFTKNYVQ